MNRPLKVRMAGTRGYPVWTLTIPSHMGRQLPQGSLFEAEWTDDGILFRFVGTERDTGHGTSNAPPWTQANGKATR